MTSANKALLDSKRDWPFSNIQARSDDYLIARTSSVSPSSELAHVACISGTAKKMPMVLIVSAKMISCKVEILSTIWFI